MCICMFTHTACVMNVCVHTCICMNNHSSLKNKDLMSHTVQDTFWLIPGLISCMCQVCTYTVVMGM